MAIFRRIRFAVTLLVLAMAVLVAAETAMTAYAAPAITLNVSSGSPPILGAGSVVLQPGTEVTISGTGFASADNGCTITSSAAGLVIDTSGEPPCLVNGSGQLTAKFKVGLGSIWELGSYGITVTGSVNTASTPGNAFAVLPAIFLTPATGVGGTSVSFYGSGFSGTTAVCAVLTGSPPVAAAPPATCAESVSPGSTLGTVTGTFTVDPTSPPGSYLIQVADAVAPIASSPPFVVGGSTATLIFTPTSGPTGTVVTVTGSGWHSADVSVTLTKASGPTSSLWGGSSPVCPVSGGTIAPGCTFTVQSIALGGVYTITGTGTQGEDVNAQFEVTTTLFLSPQGGGAGTTVTLSGSGFSGAISSLTCPTDLSSAPAGLVTSPACSVNANGILSGTFIAGTVSGGVYSVILTQASRVVPGPSVSASFNLGVPFASLSSTSGPTGTVVTVSGSGWNSGDTTVSFTASGPGTLYDPPATRSCAVSGGVIAAGCSFTVSSTALGGLYTLTFTGSQGDTATAGFTVISTFILTPNSGPDGAAVLISGTGYSGAITSAACAAGLTSAPTGLITGLSCSANANGVLSGNFIVSTSATPGSYQVILTSGKVVPGPSISAQFTVTIPAPKITLNPTFASPGATVSISGSGFSTSDTCAAPPDITSTPTNIIGGPQNCHLSGGILSTTFFTILPTAAAGTYTITVTGSTSDSASATLSVGTASPVTFTPAAAPIGATVGVTASDTGTIPPTPTCSISGTPVTSVGCTETSGGAITGSFIVANVAPGPYAITINTASGLILFGVFVVQGPFIQLSDPLSVGQIASGPTGSEVIITGAFFPLSDTTCSISTTSNGNFIAPGTAACSVFAGTGMFAGFNNVTGSFIVGNVNPGQYIVRVTTSPSGTFAEAVFNVTSGPFIQLFPSSGPTGTHVTIEGSHFLPTDTTCSLSSPTGAIIVSGACSFFTATSGPFNGFTNVTGTFIVGPVPPGDYVIQVSGNGGDSAQAIFDVTSGPFLQLFPSSGETGATVQIEGSHYSSSDTICSLSSPSGAIIVDGACSFFVPTSGPFAGFNNVTGSFIVGNVPVGQYVIQASGDQGDFAQAIFNVASGPSITLSPASGTVGTHVVVNGTNFLPTDTSCTISSPTSSAVILDGACAISAGTGKPEASFLIGNVPTGQYTIEVAGNQGDSAQALLNVTLGPKITLTPSIGRIGTDVVVTGTGFLPTDTTCTITSPSTPNFVTVAGCSVQAGTGKISGSFTVGNVVPGQYVVEVDGVPGSDFAQAVFTITIGPTLTLSPASGRIGTHVVFNGTGFLPTDTTCTVTSPGSSAVLSGSGGCSIVAGSGAPTGSFTIGNVLPGQYVIEVDGNGGDFAQRVFNVTVGAKITLRPGTAAPGISVIVNGTGFLPTDSSCTILSPGSSAVFPGSAACAIQVGTGVIQGSFITGNVLPGQYVIQVSGDQGDFAQAVLNVTAGPRLTLSPGSGILGTFINVNGTGFLTTDQSCSISSISTPNPILLGSAACAITVGTGIVKGSFVIGNVPPGEYVIEVTGCLGNNGCAPSAGDFAQAVLTVKLQPSTLTLFPTNATNGVTVTFQGTGYSPTDTSCIVEGVVEHGSGATATFVQDTNLITSSTCSIVTPTIVQGSFIVGPYATTDINWTVQVRGTPVNDIERAIFNVTASVVVVPTSGTINTVFTFTGSGFSSESTHCAATIIPPFPTGSKPGCYISGTTGQVSGSVIVPANAFPGTYGINVGDLDGHNATGFFTVGTPSALVVLNPASAAQGQPVGVAGFGFNPNDTFCVISANNPALFSPPGPTCLISGGYASGAFTISSTAQGGYYLITVTACKIAVAFPATCPAVDTLDFASNFLGVTLATTITTFSTTTTSSSTTTSMTTTTTSVATSFSFSSTTYSTTGILFTTYTHQSLTTVSGLTTTTLSQTVTTTQTQTTVTASTTTSFTTVPCGPLPCGFAIQPQPQSTNPALGTDSTGLLAALLLVIPLLLRRLFG